MKERVHRFVSNDFTLRIAAVNATEVVRHMQDLQNTAPLPTIAVGTLRQTEYTIEKHLPAVNAAGRGFLYEKFQISTSNRPIISGMVKIDKSVLRTYSALECAASRLYS